jgi:hypothetical protein
MGRGGEEVFSCAELSGEVFGMTATINLTESHVGAPRLLGKGLVLHAWFVRFHATDVRRHAIARATSGRLERGGKW